MYDLGDSYVSVTLVPDIKLHFLPMFSAFPSYIKLSASFPLLFVYTFRIHG